MLVSEKWVSVSYAYNGPILDLVHCKWFHLFAYSGRLKFLVAYGVTDDRIVYLKKNHVL